MQFSNFLNGERQREAVLASAQMLTEDRDPTLQLLAAQAQAICQAPMALLSLVSCSTQYFKGRVGIEIATSPKSHSIGNLHLSRKNPQPFLHIPDLRTDIGYYKHPLVLHEPKAVFFCGVPIATIVGLGIGSLAVLDTRPRQLSAQQILALTALARQAAMYVESKAVFQEITRHQEVARLMDPIVILEQSISESTDRKYNCSVSTSDEDEDEDMEYDFDLPEACDSKLSESGSSSSNSCSIDSAAKSSGSEPDCPLYCSTPPVVLETLLSGSTRVPDVPDSPGLAPLSLKEMPPVLALVATNGTQQQ